MMEMTENKRFIIDDVGTLIDIQTRNTYDYVSDVCPLLNALNEENEQLKQQKKGQELEIVRLHHLADAMSGVLRELGIYDVYNKEQINNVKKRLDK